MPLGMAAAEVFFWLSKIATDGWLSTLQQMGAAAVTTEGGSDETQKTD